MWFLFYHVQNDNPVYLQHELRMDSLSKPRLDWSNDDLPGTFKLFKQRCELYLCEKTLNCKIRLTMFDCLPVMKELKHLTLGR